MNKVRPGRLGWGLPGVKTDPTHFASTGDGAIYDSLDSSTKNTFKKQPGE